MAVGRNGGGESAGGQPGSPGLSALVATATGRRRRRTGAIAFVLVMAASLGWWAALLYGAHIEVAPSSPPAVPTASPTARPNAVTVPPRSASVTAAAAASSSVEARLRARAMERLATHYGPAFGMDLSAATLDGGGGGGDEGDMDDRRRIWLIKESSGETVEHTEATTPSDGVTWRTRLRYAPDPSADAGRTAADEEIHRAYANVLLEVYPSPSTKLRCQQGSSRGGNSAAWTRNGEMARATSAGDTGSTAWFGEKWLEAQVVGMTPGTPAITVFLRPVAAGQGCTRYVAVLQLPRYVRREEPVVKTDGTGIEPHHGGIVIQYRLLVRMLFTSFDHINELAEEAPLKYAEGNAAQAELLRPPGAYHFTVPAEDVPKQHPKSIAPLAAPHGWAAVAVDVSDHKARGDPLQGYWLPVKGEVKDASETVFSPDILGRQNYGLQYVHRRRLMPPTQRDACAAPVTSGKRSQGGSDAAAGERRSCLLERLRGRTIYFIGDSHIRIFFYGFLSRLQIPYPPNKIWRGDRTDVIESHNVTVKFIASYFLNLSKPVAQEMLREGGKAVIVTGVGQHHSCHCWTVEKHMTVVDDALRLLLDPATLATKASERHVLWFGIPAQPMNRHLHMAKPVGQARRDCRNNARHLLYSAYQAAIVGEKQEGLAATAAAAAVAKAPNGQPRPKRTPRIRLDAIDTFLLSVGMEHTSLDGAHYYTWSREAWIDEVERLVLQRL
jgi:hypothetical protein